MTGWTLPATLGVYVYRGAGRVARTVQNVRSPDADLLENDRSYLLLVDTPGANTTGLDIRYHGGRVQVTVERTRPNDGTLRRRFLGRTMELTTEIALPEDAVVDPEAGTARLSSHGTVKIELPKETDTAEATTGGEEIPIDD